MFSRDLMFIKVISFASVDNSNLRKCFCDLDKYVKVIDRSSQTLNLFMLGKLLITFTTSRSLKFKHAYTLFLIKRKLLICLSKSMLITDKQSLSKLLSPLHICIILIRSPASLLVTTILKPRWDLNLHLLD